MKQPKVNKTKKTAATIQEVVVLEIERALDSMVNSCQETADRIAGGEGKGELIPMDIMKRYSKSVVDIYKEGLKTNPNFK